MCCYFNEGRVVLCLDNDTAGVAAVTRLCSGTDPILLSVMEESNVDFFIAELSGTVKDPAEFLEQHRDTEEALDEKFRAEVVDGAQEWTRWYMNSLVAAHDPVPSNTTAGDEGGFGQVFDTLASFLSIFESVDERMKKAAIIAPKLADLVDADKENDDGNFNRTEISSTTRIQLASDLIEKAANFAHLKSMNAQRNYHFTYSKDAIVPKSLEFSQDITLEEGSRSKPNQNKSLQTPPHCESSSKENRSSRRQQKPPMGRQRARMKRQNTIKQIRKPMTKHISGVTATPFDDEWLGVTKNMVRFLFFHSDHHNLWFSLTLFFLFRLLVVHK
jgi:DNA primase